MSITAKAPQVARTATRSHTDRGDGTDGGKLPPDKGGPLNQAERYYAALCIALKSMRQVEHGLTRKSPDHDLKAVAKITKIQAARVRAQRTKKPSPKRKRLMGMWGLVEQLRTNEHLSFREIARFLKGISTSRSATYISATSGRRSTMKTLDDLLYRNPRWERTIEEIDQTIPLEGRLSVAILHRAEIIGNKYTNNVRVVQLRNRFQYLAHWGMWCFPTRWMQSGSWRP